ncbi:hypothetical protein EV580_2756 [Mycobacterium sp. BK086]|nr:hypothetical protein EV580_2756 [Mycobacterium sp. BK086]
MYVFTSSERTTRSTIAAHESWAKTDDRAARTLPARRAFFDSFERLVDPKGELPPEVRALRAEHARKAHYARLALLSAQARRRRRMAPRPRPEGGTERTGADASVSPPVGGAA